MYPHTLKGFKKLAAHSALVAITVIGASHTAHATSLVEAVAEAVNNHPEVKSALSNKASINYEATEAKAGYLPTIDLEVGSGWEQSNNATTRSRGSRPTTNGDSSRDMWRSESSITLRQMLYDGGRTYNQVRQQKARTRSASSVLEETQENIALRAVEAYLDVLRNEDLVDLAQENVDNHQDYLNKIKARAQGGRGSQADVQQAEARLALAHASLTRAKGDRDNAVANYEEVVGLDVEGLKMPSIPASALASDRKAAVSYALERNPAIASAKADIEAANASTQETKSNFLPRVDLELSAARNENLDGSPNENNEAMSMVRMRYNLYNGGADQALKRQRLERLSQARHELDVANRIIAENVSVAWNNMVTAKNRIKPLSEHVAAVSKTRNAYLQQFEINQRSLLDLLDTEVEVFNAKQALINGRYAADFAVYEVLANTGVLVETVQASNNL